MKLADCTPLPGNGFAARAGNLVVRCASADGDEDLLLSAMDKVAARGGDGSDLVRQITRAALSRRRTRLGLCWRDGRRRPCCPGARRRDGTGDCT